MNLSNSTTIIVVFCVHISYINCENLCATLKLPSVHRAATPLLTTPTGKTKRCMQLTFCMFVEVTQSPLAEYFTSPLFSIAYPLRIHHGNISQWWTACFCIKAIFQLPHVGGRFALREIEKEITRCVANCFACLLLWLLLTRLPSCPLLEFGGEVDHSACVSMIFSLSSPIFVFASIGRRCHWYHKCGWRTIHLANSTEWLSL